jgi:hypothetical protein
VGKILGLFFTDGWNIKNLLGGKHVSSIPRLFAVPGLLTNILCGSDVQ